MTITNVYDVSQEFENAVEDLIDVYHDNLAQHTMSWDELDYYITRLSEDDSFVGATINANYDSNFAKIMSSHDLPKYISFHKGVYKAETDLDDIQDIVYESLFGWREHKFLHMNTPYEFLSSQEKGKGLGKFMKNLRESAKFESYIYIGENALDTGAEFEDEDGYSYYMDDENGSHIYKYSQLKKAIDVWYKKQQTRTWNLSKLVENGEVFHWQLIKPLTKMGNHSERGRSEEAFAMYHNSAWDIIHILQGLFDMEGVYLNVGV